MKQIIGILRRAAAAGLLLASGAAAPSLTTIQDVLYKADGTRFNGTAVISWSTFEAADGSNVGTQTLTVKIVDGGLKVQLVPNTGATPPVYYTVKYNSDGRVQFEETWAVPPSTSPLRVRDVRMAAPGLSQDTASEPVQETDIVGLTADLSARPLKGPGFAPGRSALISPSGAIEAVTGNPTDCVRVDGTSGPCGAPEPQFVDGETPSGLADGANAQFGLQGVPNPASSLAIYRNGLLMKPGLDYTASGNSVQFVVEAVPQAGDTLLASYRTSGTSAAGLPAPEVICSGSGGTASGTTFTTLGICTIPAGTLRAGDRIEVRFDYGQTGSSGFTATVKWGSTEMIWREGAAGDTMLTGKAEAAVYDGGAQISTQTWGTVSAPATSLANATDDLQPSLTLTFLGRVAQDGGQMSLRSYTVIRYARTM